MAHCHFCRPAPELERSQPDEGDPYRLLGICPRCRRWYLCEALPAPSRSRVVHLRDVPRLEDYRLEPAAPPTRAEALAMMEELAADAAAVLVPADSAAAGPPARF